MTKKYYIISDLSFYNDSKIIKNKEALNRFLLSSYKNWQVQEVEVNKFNKFYKIAKEAFLNKPISWAARKTLKEI